ncbi:hypothetical protein GOP47_0007405 [Adiantum capillus-veneris]|uniref:5-formyltetrahydrofolate cyclo-ligase n=1 Tax=Adiantum capillus-veneris TaxID=13818 RepID=A0A9D4V0M3_ADICA|nr:hypothetical protein GOP47_0007405 [Adiantum capillus-veneris]
MPLSFLSCQRQTSYLPAQFSTVMSSIFEQKKALRSRIRRELRLRYPSLALEEDPMIQKYILESPWYKNSHHICAYISCPSIREVGTTQVVSDIFQKAETEHPKSLYVPWIQDKQSHLKFFHICSNEDLAANSMGILEPIPVKSDGSPREDVMQADVPIDLILMPGLAFDRAGRRLGRGGGYYDCFVKEYISHAEKKGWRSPLLVGMAYSLQILDEAFEKWISSLLPQKIIESKLRKLSKDDQAALLRFSVGAEIASRK